MREHSRYGFTFELKKFGIHSKSTNDFERNMPVLLCILLFS
jgi:hypothetical protein